MLIGKLQNGFFSFDSHSRSTEGMLSIFGKSTRVLLQSVEEVFSHIQNLALSMGYSKSVECNLTGVSCQMNYIGNDSSLHKTGDVVTHFEQTNIQVESSFETDDGKDDLIFIAQDQIQFSFTPMTTSLKKNLCQKVNVPYISDSAAIQFSISTMTTPRQEKEILGDGNCFFRAVSFCLTNSEDFYNVMRSAVCQHII